MSQTCSIETGLFKKKPCGQAAVTKCTNCEQPLCKQHAVAKKPGVFMCKECAAADVQFDKNQADVAKAEKAKRDAEMMKSMMNPAAPKPKTSYTQAAPGATPPAAAKPAAAGAPAPAAAPKPAEDAPLEFTPTKPKPAAAAPKPAAAPAPAPAPAPKPADDAPLEFTPSKPKPADDAPLEFDLNDDKPKK